MISVLIFTKNEQQDLPGCLESVMWSDDIHVFDSMSTDQTVTIARHYGAHVTLREYSDCNLPFGGDESTHRNWAIQNIPFKYEWVYHSDADERVTAELLTAMLEAIKSNNDYSAFRVRRRDYLYDRWLKHVTPSPFNIRLFKWSCMRFERAINPVPLVDGKIADLDAHFDHFSFSKGISFWIAKHNSYSSLEAQQIIANRNQNTSFSIINALIAKDFNERRFHQKELFYRMPFRPLFKFLILYVGKLGFLDGYAGFTYAVLQSIYEYFIVLKTRELQVVGVLEK